MAKKVSFPEFDVTCKNGPVEGAYLIQLPCFGDSRGWFKELYNNTKPHYAVDKDPSHKKTLTFPQISLSDSMRGVMRGMHCSPYGKLVSLITGKLFDVVVDLRPSSPTYKNWQGAWLSADQHRQVYVPPGCGHGFIAIEDHSMIMYKQEGPFNGATENDLNMFDEDIGIEWPLQELGFSESDLVISEKDRNAPKLATRKSEPEESHNVDYLVFGATGYLGENVVKYLEKGGYKYAISYARVEDRHSVIAELMAKTPRYVICAAGIAGKPNIDWCETHREETIRANIAGQLIIAEACAERGIHCTLFGTGSLYCYDDEHPMGSGKGYPEDAEPNFTGNFYVRMRIELEKLLENFTNVLNLRIVYPISDDMHPKMVVSKLLKYPKIMSVPTSFTVVDDLFPLIPKMAEKGMTGPVNFTNPGVVDHDTILTIFRDTVDPSCSWELAEPGSGKRPNCELDTTKMTSEFPEIPHVKDAVRAVFERVKANGTYLKAEEPEKKRARTNE